MTFYQRSVFGNNVGSECPACEQELCAAGDQEGSVRAREARSAAHGGDDSQLPDVRQIPALGGISGQRGMKNVWVSQTAACPVVNSRSTLGPEEPRHNPSLNKSFRSSESYKNPLITFFP